MSERDLGSQMPGAGLAGGEGPAEVELLAVAACPFGDATGNGDAPTAIDVVIPHATGSSRAGNTAVMLSLRVGTRIGRCHHAPHLWALTVYTYEIQAASPGYSGNRPSECSNSSQTSLNASRSCLTCHAISSTTASCISRQRQSSQTRSTFAPRMAPSRTPAAGPIPIKTTRTRLTCTDSSPSQ